VSGRAYLVAAAVLCGGWAHAAPVPPGSATAGKAKRPVGSGMLNLNTASLDQIDALPGISPAVQGVSRKRFERLRPHLTVTGPTNFVPGAGRPKPAGKASARQQPGVTRP